MAASGYTPISLYYSTTASAAPTAGNLVSGELAINITDGKLYYKDNAGAVQTLAGKGGTGVVAGSNTQIQYNNNGVFGASSALTFDNSNLFTLSTSTPVFRLTPSVNTALQGIEFGSAVVTDAFIKQQPSTGEFRISSGRSAGWGGFTSFYIDTVEAMRLNSTGLGIGTSSPAVRLESRITTTGLPVTSGTTQTNGVLRLSSSQTTGILDFGSNSGAPWIQATDRTDLSQTYQLLLNPNGGNVGIGTSSPSSKLTISGTAATGAVTFLSTGTTTNYNVGQFTSTGGNFYFGLDNNAGTAFSGSSAYGGIVGTGNSTNLGLVTNSVVRATLDSSGNLGLGVTPSAWASGNKFMDVNSSASFGAFGSTDTMMLANAYWNGTNWVRKNAQNAFRFVMESINTTPTMNWQVAANGAAGSTISFTQAMTLDASGQLGIGTSSPAVKLQVYNNINGTPFAWGNATRTGYLYQDQNGVGITNASGTSFDEGVYLDTANSKVILYTNSTDRVTLDSSGNLGLGVTPSAWGGSWKALELPNGIAYTTAFGINYQTVNAYHNGSNFIYKNSSVASYYQNGPGSHAWHIAGSGTAGNAITFTQAMTLDSSGNWVIGATSAGYTTSGRIVGYINGTSSALLGFGIGGSQAGYLGAFSSGVELAAEGAKAILLTTNGSERARIDSSGNLMINSTSSGSLPGDGYVFIKTASTQYIGHANNTASGTGYLQFWYNGSSIGSVTQSGTTAVLYNTTSDQRLKENIANADSASSLIDSLQVRKFDWKADGSHQRYGFIAQELVSVAPEAVHQPINPEEMMAVDYSKLVPMLVKEIQSLRKRLADAGIA